MDPFDSGNRGFGLQITPASYWSTEYTGFLSIYTAVFMIILIGLGFFWGGRPKTFNKIVDEVGKLSTDFVEVADLGTTLINMGLVGLIGLGYILMVEGDVNGATMAGILTIVGFGALGKHPRNIFPIMLGVYFFCIPNVWQHANPGPLLAAKKAIGELGSGEVMEILSSDEGTKRDIPKWASKKGHEYLGTIEESGYFKIYMKKQ